MSDKPADRQSLLRAEGSDLSEASSSTAQPRTFRTMASPQDTKDYTDPAPRYSSPIPAISEFEPLDIGTQGLGISTRRQSIQRVPVGARSSVIAPRTNPFIDEHEAIAPTPPTPYPFNQPSSSTSTPEQSAPNSTNPLLSPGWPMPSSGNSSYNGRGEEPARPQSVRGQGISKGKSIFTEAPDVGYGEINDRTGRPNFPVNNDNDNDNDIPKLIDGCPAKHNIHAPRRSWLSISILMLSIYSTLFSGFYLCLALAQPRYGRFIHSGGQLTPATASILFALFAKTIELSFVTVFITFLGQVLSRRSLVKASRGVTIAEMTMRTWVIQPGFMITHFRTLQKAAITMLGMISLTVALVAMLYTTASDALVSPHLKFGKAHERILYGLVQTSYANPKHISDSCQTPISVEVDRDNAGLTCLAVSENAGQAYHNSITFLDTWAQIRASGQGASTDIGLRPQAPGMLYDNTTVVGSWVETNSSDMNSSYHKYNRIVNNVTVSMPHAGIFAAARASKNGILQPEDLAGIGEYTIEASVVSPTLNVRCANMNATELAPLIYTEFPNANITNSSSMPGQRLAAPGYENDIHPLPGKQYLNSTVVDDIFEWGEKYKRQAPVFPRYPIEYNSITNVSVADPGKPSDSIYMLIKAPDSSTPDYTICQIRSYLSTNCSTFYNVSGLAGGHLAANCQPGNKMSYDKSVPTAPVPGTDGWSWKADWRNVGSLWITSLSLNTGITNGNSSTSRLLAQLIPVMPGWGDVTMNKLTPTIAELLAVMGGSTLMLSSTSSSFYHYWDANYTANELNPGAYEPFNATLSTQQYTSGLSQKWQGMFYVVLTLVFLTNVFCLVYFCLRSGLVTDYTEPQNLFALAVNSPPSDKLSGSCGSGPEGDQLNVDWHVHAEDSSGHFFIKEGGAGGESYEMRRRLPQNMKSMTSYSKLSSKRSSFL